MQPGDLCLPSMPPNAIRESNRGTLDRLECDLILIDNEQLSPVDAYRFYGYDALDQPFWGYGVEVARMDNSSEIFVLMRRDEQSDVDKLLHWMLLTDLYSRKQAYLFYQVLDTEGPSEAAMHESLKLFRDVFDYAVDTGWDYETRLEFYHSYPFEELLTKEAVMAFRPILFGSPAFADIECNFPECE